MPPKAHQFSSSYTKNDVATLQIKTNSPLFVRSMKVVDAHNPFITKKMGDMAMGNYADFYQHSLSNPEDFWREQSLLIDW